MDIHRSFIARKQRGGEVFRASQGHRVRDEVREGFRNEGQEELKILRGITRNGGFRRGR